MKFSEFGNIGKTAGNLTSDVLVEGSFACQVCGEDCAEATYSNVSKILSWVCLSKHISLIEDFKL